VLSLLDNLGFNVLGIGRFSVIAGLRKAQAVSGDHVGESRRFEGHKLPGCSC